MEDEITFTKVPMQVSPHSSRYFLNNALNLDNDNKSDVLCFGELRGINAELVFSFPLSLSTIVDYVIFS